jgi:hypothetical protein
MKVTILVSADPFNFGKDMVIFQARVELEKWQMEEICATVTRKMKKWQGIEAGHAESKGDAKAL